MVTKELELQEYIKEMSINQTQSKFIFQTRFHNFKPKLSQTHEIEIEL